jgi:predicted lipoprotein with Yx(FWY)xxD motif
MESKEVKEMRTFLTLVAMTLVTSLGAVAVAQKEMKESTPAEHLAVMDHEVLGPYLTDSHGRTLYIVVDGDDQSVACTGECADAWPPFTLESIDAMMGDAMMDESMSDDAMAMATIDTDLVGTVARDDGTTQVTYQGHPLYYFVGDVDPGEVNCQAIDNFGGTWYVVAPSGEIVKTAP